MKWKYQLDLFQTFTFYQFLAKAINMTTSKNKKIEGLTKEVKDLQDSRAKTDEERASLSVQIHQLKSDSKYLTRQVPIMTGIIQKQNQQIKTLDM